MRAAVTVPPGPSWRGAVRRRLRPATPIVVAAALLLLGAASAAGLAAASWWLERAARVDLPTAADPAVEGFDPAALEGLAARMVGRLRSEAFLVARHGRPVVERYRPAGDDGVDPPTPAPAARWWSNAGGAWPELPRGLLVAAGAQHRVVIVVPSLGLVAVRLDGRFGGDDSGGGFWARLRAELLGPLLGAARHGDA